jgi:hypothetical protein
MPSLKLSKYSFILMIAIGSAHFLLAAGFMLSVFHASSGATAGVVDKETIVNAAVKANITG